MKTETQDIRNRNFQVFTNGNFPGCNFEECWFKQKIGDAAYPLLLISPFRCANVWTVLKQEEISSHIPIINQCRESSTRYNWTAWT
jgi:hypothetical protein